jgi:hypothetical protein
MRQAAVPGVKQAPPRRGEVAQAALPTILLTTVGTWRDTEAVACTEGGVVSGARRARAGEARSAVCARAALAAVPRREQTQNSRGPGEGLGVWPYWLSPRFSFAVGILEHLVERHLEHPGDLEGHLQRG